MLSLRWPRNREVARSYSSTILDSMLKIYVDLIVLHRQMNLWHAAVTVEHACCRGVLTDAIVTRIGVRRAGAN